MEFVPETVSLLIASILRLFHEFVSGCLLFSALGIGSSLSLDVGGEILPKPKRFFIAQSLSCSPFHCPEITELLLKGHKTLTHPSCLWMLIVRCFRIGSSMFVDAYCTVL